MSKKMGLSFLASLSPITSNAMNQVRKLGGRSARELIGEQFSGQGIKSWWAGKHISYGGGTNIGWHHVGGKAQQAATMKNRRHAVYGAAAFLGMNAMVGDDGFLGFAKSTVNTTAALSAGALAKKPLWKATKGMGSIGKFGLRGGAMGVAGYWAGSKLGVI